MLAAFTYRDFRVQWFGACTSSIGTWMQIVAQNWMVAVADRVGVLPRPRRVPAAAADHALHADRRRARRSPRSPADAARLAVRPDGDGGDAGRARLLRASSRSGTSSLLSFITGLAQAFGGPAYQSLIPSLVDKKDLPNAVALNSIQFNVARVLGPLLFAATLVAFRKWGFNEPQAMAACFALNALSFLVVIYTLMSLHVKHIPPATTSEHARRAARRALVRPAPRQPGRAHRARGDDDVPGVRGADVPAALHEERLSRGRRAPTAT